jgi:FMN phosphatase YigB (HAD superfamily)
MTSTKMPSSISSRNRPRRITKSPRPKALLCDLGNVLVNFDHRFAVRRIIPYTDRSFAEIYRLFFDSPLTKAYEEGKISSRRFYEGVRDRLSLKGLNYRVFAGIWSAIFFDNPGIVGVLARVKPGIRRHMISNINKLHYDYIRRRFPRHLGVFDRFVLSYEVGERKPHPKIYRAAIEAAGFSPEEVLYTDDRADLIEEAERLGIPSLLFTGVADLCRALGARGLLR